MSETIQNPRRVPRALARCEARCLLPGGGFWAAGTIDFGPHGCQLFAPAPLPARRADQARPHQRAGGRRAGGGRHGGLGRQQGALAPRRGLRGAPTTPPRPAGSTSWPPPTRGWPPSAPRRRSWTSTRRCGSARCRRWPRSSARWTPASCARWATVPSCGRSGSGSPRAGRSWRGRSSRWWGAACSRPTAAPAATPADWAPILSRF